MKNLSACVFTSFGYLVAPCVSYSICDSPHLSQTSSGIRRWLWPEKLPIIIGGFLHFNNSKYCACSLNIKSLLLRFCFSIGYYH